LNISFFFSFRHDLVIYCGLAANVICHRTNFIMTVRDSRQST
jgi:hypothetical protein